MRKIIDYTVLSSNDTHDLEKLVLGYMANCWQPLGGIAITRATPNDIMIEYCQAMVRYEPENGPKDGGYEIVGRDGNIYHTTVSG